MKIVSGEKPLRVLYVLAEPDAKEQSVELVPNQEFSLPDDCCIVGTEIVQYDPTKV